MGYFIIFIITTIGVFVWGWNAGAKNPFFAPVPAWILVLALKGLVGLLFGRVEKDSES